MDVTLFLVVNIPTAVAFIPPLGAVVSPIVGALVNPDPSFKRDIFLTNPVPIVAVAVAIDPPLNIWRSVITPRSSVLLSIASIPVTYDASDLLKCTVTFNYSRYSAKPANNNANDPSFAYLAGKFANIAVDKLTGIDLLGDVVGGVVQRSLSN